MDDIRRRSLRATSHRRDVPLRRRVDRRAASPSSGHGRPRPGHGLAESPFRVSPLSGVLLGPSLTSSSRGAACVRPTPRAALAHPEAAHRSFTHTRTTKSLLIATGYRGVAATRCTLQTPHAHRCARAAVRRAARAERSGSPRVAHEARRGASKQCHLTRPSHPHTNARRPPPQGERSSRRLVPTRRVRRFSPTPCPALSS